MYRVILADDESLDLEAMEKLVPWSDFGMEVVHTAANGRKVLDYLRSGGADLLVSDIRMPIISGLELGRLAKELHPGMKMVFVSGHEDFYYAKQALQIGASGYVLKPVDDYELAKLLEDVRRMLDAERKSAQLELQFREAMPVVLNEKLMRWIRKELPPEVVPELMEQLGLPAEESDYSALLIELDEISLRGLSAEDETGRMRILSEWRNLLQGQLSDYGPLLTCQPGPTQMLAVFGLPYRDLGRYAASLLETGKQSLALSYTIASSDTFQSLMRLSELYASATEALDQKLFLGRNRFIAPADVQESQKVELDSLEEQLSKLFSVMAQYELVQIDDCLSELFALARRLERRITVYSFTQHILSKLDAYLVTINENLQSILGISFEELDILYHFETVDDIHSWMRRRIFEISELLHRKKTNRNRKVIAEIEKYVEERLEQPIVLREVAERFSFSPNYLGHLFKEETGCHFSDFVTKKRLAKACELLKDNRIKIYEVAFLVGYKNLTHFSKLFKNTYGLTPNEFRRKA
jgi:two-component system response regulator YesN